MVSDSGLPAREERLRIALDAGDVGTWEWNIVTGEVTWTETLERIHGFAPGSFGGTFDVYQSYIHADDRPAVLAAIEASVAKQVPYEVEYRMYKPDGSTHWVSARGRVFADESGQPRAMLGICMDISERRRATDALRLLSDVSSTLGSSLEYETTLPLAARLCIPHLGDWCAIDLLEDDGSLRRVALVHRDPQKEQMARELDQHHPTRADAPNGPGRVVRTGATELVAEISPDLLRENAHDDEHLKRLTELGMRSYLCLPLTARGRILGALTLINAEPRRPHDLQDLRLAEELAGRAALAIDNARLYQRSLEASRAKDEFLATLSHELRTPLTAVLGYASLLETGKLEEEERRSAIEAIKSSARAQARLVEDILEVSRQVLGKVRLDMMPMDLVPVVRAAADAFTPAARAKNLDLAVHAAVDVCFVQADPNRIQQILWNLLANAVKFTPGGGHVSVNVAVNGADAVIEVHDDGAGIAPDLLPHVFERFRQCSSSREQGGLGLGLAIVRHLVEMHAGTVAAESRGEGTGATFTVRLPLLRAHDERREEPMVLAQP